MQIPPLGVIPKIIWEAFVLHDRRKELERAIKDRIGTPFDIPEEWIQERSEIIKRITELESGLKSQEKYKK